MTACRNLLARLGDWRQGVVDGVFAGARACRETRSGQQPADPNAMEPRVAIGDFDTSSGDFTLYTTSQNPHVIRLLMGAFVLHIPENKLRVVAPDVGGGFGSKIYHYAEKRSSPGPRARCAGR